MFSKALIAWAAANLVGEVVAGGVHGGVQHNHGQLHKRKMVTHIETKTEWVTVTVTIGAQGHGSEPTAPADAPPAPTPTEAAQVTPTTLIKQPAPVSSEKPASPAPQPVGGTPDQDGGDVKLPPTPATTAQAPPPEPTPSKTPSVPKPQTPSGDSGATGHAQLGLAYNDAKLLKTFLGTGSKATWTYNWGQYGDWNLGVEFVPMLWGLKNDFQDSWDAAVKENLAKGAKCLLSFNEPDIESQANMTPEFAAEKHIQFMNPYAGKARIGSPAVSNSDRPLEGIPWLELFMDACADNCAVDFLNIHSYGISADALLQHLVNVHNKFNKPIWITEYKFPGSDEEAQVHLEHFVEQIENNSTYSFVERHAYFFVAEGEMLAGNAPKAFAKELVFGV